MQKHFQYSSKEVFTRICLFTVGVHPSMHLGRGSVWTGMCTLHSPNPSGMHSCSVYFHFVLHSPRFPSMDEYPIQLSWPLWKAYHIHGPYHRDWWLSELPFWIKVDFLPKILGIMTHVINKQTKSQKWENSGNWNYKFLWVLQAFWCSVESEAKMIIWMKPSLFEVRSSRKVRLSHQVIVHSLMFCCILRFYLCRFVWCTTYGAGSLADSPSLSMNTNVICTVSIPLQTVLITNIQHQKQCSIKQCKTWNSTSSGIVTYYTSLKCIVGTSFDEPLCPFTLEKKSCHTQYWIFAVLRSR